MSQLNVSELLKIYLDGNSNENQDVLGAEYQLLQLGHSVVPTLLQSLANQLGFGA